MPLIRAKVYDRNASDTSIHMVVQYKNSFNRRFVKVPMPYGTTRTTHEYKILQYLNGYFKSTLPYIPRCPKLRYGVYLSRDVLHVEERSASSTSDYVPFVYKFSEDTRVDPNLVVRTSMVESPYIPNTTPVDSLTDQQKISCIYQLLLVTGILNMVCGYTHYDLHVNNVMHHQHIWKHGDYILFVYDDDNQFLVDTHGMCPVLVDHEYAYTPSTYNHTMGESHLSHHGITPWRTSTWWDSYRLCNSIIQTGYLSDSYTDTLRSKMSTLFHTLSDRVGSDGLLQLGDESVITQCANKLYNVIFPSNITPTDVPDDHYVLTDGLDDIVQRLLVYTTWTSLPMDVYAENEIPVICQEGIEWVLNMYDEMHEESSTAEDTMTRLMYTLDAYIHDQSCPIVPLMCILRVWFDEFTSSVDETLLQLSDGKQLPHGIAMFCTLQQEWGAVSNPIKTLRLYDVQTKSMYEVDVNDAIKSIVAKYTHDTMNQLTLASELYVYLTDTPV